VKKVVMIATLISITTAAISGFFVIKYGMMETSLSGAAQLELTLRLDALSILMLAMIALISFIVVRFSLNYLDGDPQQGAFIGRLAASIAMV